MPQHPFTPEPQEPEPWPERDPSPWEWAGGEMDASPDPLPGVEHTVVVNRSAATWFRQDDRVRAAKRIRIGFR